ncbi:MAG: hypothetical protein QM651_12310 [Rhodoblastus sp.]
MTSSELRRSHTSDLRLVSRHPRKVNEADTLVAAVADIHREWADKSGAAP